jgi:Tfp pilus assembly protein PilN
MLRANLSTRPFYNERGVHAVAAVVAVLVLAVTAWQVVRVVRLSRYKTELNSAITRDRTEAAVRAAEAQQTRRGLDQKELALVAARAKEANGLIEQRTFSWTALFNQLSSTLPDDVMLTGIHPEFKEGETQVSLDVQGRGSEDISAFWDRLEKTGSFRDIAWSDVDVSEDGLHKIRMTALYTPAHALPRPASTNAPRPAPAITVPQLPPGNGARR